MTKIGVRQFRANLHKVLDFVLMKNGRVTITQYGEPIAEIVPLPRDTDSFHSKFCANANKYSRIDIRPSA
jgi:prevent-host-death family protein